MGLIREGKSLLTIPQNASLIIREVPWFINMLLGCRKWRTMIRRMIWTGDKGGWFGCHQIPFFKNIISTCYLISLPKPSSFFHISCWYEGLLVLVAPLWALENSPCEDILLPSAGRNVPCSLCTFILGSILSEQCLAAPNTLRALSSARGSNRKQFWWALLFWRKKGKII